MTMQKPPTLLIDRFHNLMSEVQMLRQDWILCMDKTQNYKQKRIIIILQFIFVLYPYILATPIYWIILKMPSCKHKTTETLSVEMY